MSLGKIAGKVLRAATPWAKLAGRTAAEDAIRKTTRKGIAAGSAAIKKKK
jgi:hypothetical protein